MVGSWEESMSVRYNATGPAPVAAPPAAHPMFNLPTSRLYHVLSVGAAQSELSDAAFEDAVHHYVEEIGAKMTKEERKRLKEAAMRKAKEGSKFVVKKGEQGAQELVNTVKRTWAGAKKPAHWMLLKPNELAKRLSDDYKRAIEKKGWDNIRAAADATRVLHAETGASMHAVIAISRKEVIVTIKNSMIGSTQSITGTKIYDSVIDTTDFKQFKLITDTLIKKLVVEFKRQFGM